MTGGSLTAAEGPMLRMTNTAAVVELNGDAKLNAASGVLVEDGTSRMVREAA